MPLPTNHHLKWAIAALVKVKSGQNILSATYNFKWQWGLWDWKYHNCGYVYLSSVLSARDKQKEQTHAQNMIYVCTCVTVEWYQK